jgi:hypothetical protein
MSAEGDRRSDRPTTWFIDRPDVDFDAIEHVYEMEGERVVGVSTAAKVGGIDSAWDIASAWGFRVGYEGVHTLAGQGWTPFEAKVWSDELKRPDTILVETQDQLRSALKFAKLTPWATRDKAAERGSWVHDGLEDLGQDGDVPDLDAFAKEHGAEAAGHMRSVLRFYLYFRPSFVALEVQVASRTHRFAGRYDVRCLIDARRLLVCIDELRQDPQALRVRQLALVAEHRKLPLGHPEACALCLLDLKTSKGVYPETHFPQLEGYEGAGVEMGFPATDARLVLNTWPTGEHEPGRDLCVSWATYEHFLAYLEAMRAIRRIKHELNPEKIRKRAREAALLALLPGRSRDLVGKEGLDGMDSRSIGMALGGLRKKGRVEQDDRTKVWSLVA